MELRYPKGNKKNKTTIIAGVVTQEKLQGVNSGEFPIMIESGPGYDIIMR